MELGLFHLIDDFYSHLLSGKHVSCQLDHREMPPADRLFQIIKASNGGIIDGSTTPKAHFKGKVNSNRSQLEQNQIVGSHDQMAIRTELPPPTWLSCQTAKILLKSNISALLSENMFDWKLFSRQQFLGFCSRLLRILNFWVFQYDLNSCEYRTSDWWGVLAAMLRGTVGENSGI